MWLGKNESSSFWMGVLTDLKARGVEDVLITATDNLNGFTGAIGSVFAESQTQIGVVHQKCLQICSLEGQERVFCRYEAYLYRTYKTGSRSCSG